MSKPVLSSLLVLLLVVGACPSLPPIVGTDLENDIDDDVCTCVEGECIAPQALATAIPKAPREQPT